MAMSCWRIVEALNSKINPFLANCTHSSFSSHYSLWMLNILSVHLSLASTVPFGRPSASFENSIVLSFCLTITTASLSDPVQNTTPEYVLSLCWCHERSEQSHSSQGYMAWCGCHEILIALWYTQEVLCRDLSMSETKNLSHPDDKRITQRSQSNTNWRDKKSAFVISGRVWRVFQCMLVHRICLYFLCSRTLIQVVLDVSFKIEEFLHRMVISLNNYRVE